MMLTTEIFSADDTLAAIKVQIGTRGTFTFSVRAGAEHDWEIDSHFHFVECPAHICARSTYMQAVTHLIHLYENQGFVINRDLLHEMHDTWAAMLAANNLSAVDVAEHATPIKVGGHQPILFRPPPRFILMETAPVYRAPVVPSLQSLLRKEKSTNGRWALTLDTTGLSMRHGFDIDRIVRDMLVEKAEAIAVAQTNALNNALLTAFNKNVGR